MCISGTHGSERSSRFGSLIFFHTASSAPRKNATFAGEPALPIVSSTPDVYDFGLSCDKPIPPTRRYSASWSARERALSEAHAARYASSCDVRRGSVVCRTVVSSTTGVSVCFSSAATYLPSSSFGQEPVLGNFSVFLKTNFARIVVIFNRIGWYSYIARWKALRLSFNYP